MFMQNKNQCSSYFRFSVVVAIIHLICMVAILWLIFESNNRTGKDGWIIFYVVIPAFLIQFTAPINLISGLYYFVKYRNDEIQYKIIVGLAFLSSVVLLILRLR